MTAHEKVRHHGPKKKTPTTRAESPAPPAETSEPGRRLHGDSYSDVVHEDESLGTASTHAARRDRRPEEPTDAELGDAERLDGT